MPQTPKELSEYYFQKSTQYLLEAVSAKEHCEEYAAELIQHQQNYYTLHLMYYALFNEY